MHVQDPEALKKWLSSKIGRLCEADELTLAKYILALIRKDKPEDDLRRFCVRQLYVFFRRSTRAFVDRLFQTVRSGSYLNPTAADDDISDIINAAFLPPSADDFEAEAALGSSDQISENTADISMNPEQQFKSEFSASGYSGAAAGPSTVGENRFRNYPMFGNYPPPSQGSQYSDAPLYVPTATKGVKSEGSGPSSSASSTVAYNGSKQERCADYDKKGFCMRGNFCPFDHGSDPLIVNVDSGLGLKVPTSQDPSNTGFNFTMPPPLPSRPPPPLPPLPKSPPPPLSDFYLPEPYNPESPGMNMDSERKSYNDYKRSHFRHLSGLSASSGGESSFASYRPVRARELIGVPISNNSAVEKKNENLEQASVKKRKSYFSPLGGAKKVPKMSYNKSVLEVRRIPVHLNRMENLINHFRRFGTVIHIQIEYEDDPEAALVEYSREEEAVAAYRSAEPVLDNRFIKVFFQRQIESNVQSSSSVQSSSNVQSSSSVQFSSSSYDNASSSALYARPSTSRQFFNPPPRGGHRYAYGRNLQRLNARAVNKRWELYVKKRELLDGQLGNQKLVLRKLEKAKKPAEKESLKKLMFELSSKIRAFQAELKVEGQEIKAQFEALNRDGISRGNAVRERERNESQQVQNAAALRVEVDKLEAKAKSLGILDHGETSFGNREERAAKETAPSNGASSAAGDKSPDLVCRPKSLLVTGLANEVNKENLKKHFEEFGSVEKMDDAPIDNIIITFSSPEEAEKAFQFGKNFGNISLNLELHEDVTEAPASPGASDLDNKLPPLYDYDDDDEDDDEEEESEARSWRH